MTIAVNIHRRKETGG